MASPRRGAFAFPVYQIDFSAVAAGKHVAASKRRVRWRFGFPNRQALAAGRTGTECRGEEHDVIVIWSVASGKRQVLMDGKEVHYSSNRTGILDHSWSTRANHVIKVVCHAAPPMTPTPGFRQYDLFIDGQSFFLMPKVYELGLKGPIPSHDRVPGLPAMSREAIGDTMGGGIRAPRSLDEEEEEVRRAIQLSLDEAKRHLQQKAGTSGGSVDGSASAPPAQAPAPDVLDTNTADLLDFGGPSPAPLPALPPTDQASYASYGSAPYGSASGQPYGSTYGAPPPPPSQSQQQQSSYYGGPPPPPSSVQQTTSYGSYQPGPPPQQPPQQTYLALPPSTNSQQYYGAPPPPSAPAYGTSSSAYGAPPASSSATYQEPLFNYGAPAPSSYAPDAFGLHTPDDPFAPKPPTHSEIANDILKAYGSPASTPNAGASGANAWGGTQSYNPENGQGNQANNNSQQPLQNGSGGGATSTALTMNGLIETEEEPTNPFEAALKKLVNVDHIDQPAEEKLKLTMKKEEEEKAKKQKNKSRGLPPAAQKLVGSHATLAQIQTVKQPTSSQKKDVMRQIPQLFSPDAAMAGALVVHGAPMPLGPPPLQPQGFGVGFRTAPPLMMSGAGMVGGGIGFAQQPQIYGAAGQQQQMYYAQQAAMAQQQQQQMAAAAQQQQQSMMYGQPPPPPATPQHAQYQYR